MRAVAYVGITRRRRAADGIGGGLRRLGAEVRVCAPPDFADLAARADVELIPLGDSLRDMLHGEKPLTPADAPRMAAALGAMQFDTVAAAADGCDAVVASGLMPAGRIPADGATLAANRLVEQITSGRAGNGRPASPR
jgi:hypothetical protein